MDMHLRIFLGRRAVRRWVLAITAFGMLTVIVASNLGPRRFEVSVGQVSRYDIEAPRTAENRYRTQILKEEAGKQAIKDATQNTANYDINPAEAISAEEKLVEAFGHIKAAKTSARSSVNLDALRLDISNKAGVPVSRDVLRKALELSEDDLSQAEKVARSAVLHVLRQQRVTPDSVAEAQRVLDESLESMGLPPGVLAVAGGFARSLVSPNLILNPVKLEKVRQQAVGSVQPVVVQKGQIFLRKGDVVLAEHVQILQDLGMLRLRGDYRASMGSVFLVVLVFSLLGFYLLRFNPEILANEASLALLALLILAVSGISRVLSLVPWEGMGYLSPVPFAAILASVLLDSRLAIPIVVALSVIASIIFGGASGFLVVSLAAGMAAIYSVSKVSQRSDLTRSGFISGATSSLAMLSMGLLAGEPFAVLHSWVGLVSGVAWAIGSIGSLPYLESLFNITSAIRLLELSNPNHPLLRELLTKAPGTYHHSILVGNLSEAAARAVEADPLLTRVGAQYHDIGKIRRPPFFVENQFAGGNPHDRLSPALSALVITSHVKEGVELARQFKLPEVIVDFIRMHHGTDLAKYFYRRAVEHQISEECFTERSGDMDLDEGDFRYPGPKPQTKETAIVMLADAAEAAVRCTPEPSSGKIEGTVRRIIKDRLEDGQLDESNLTLKELGKIADAFVRVLSGMYHTRIEYPEPLVQAERHEARGSATPRMNPGAWRTGEK